MNYKQQQVVPLFSVGSLFDIVKGIVYPDSKVMNTDHFETTGTPIVDCDIEWFENLDDDDMKIVAIYYETNIGMELDDWLNDEFPNSKWTSE